MDHLFRKCPLSAAVWEALSIFNLTQGTNLEFEKWLTKVFDSLPRDQRRTFCGALYAIGQVAKVNFDGAYDMRNHQSASGIVVRDSKGHVLISCTELHREVASPFAAEVIACRRVTQIGRHDIHEMNKFCSYPEISEWANSYSSNRVA